MNFVKVVGRGRNIYALGCCPCARKIVQAWRRVLSHTLSQVDRLILKYAVAPRLARGSFHSLDRRSATTILSALRLIQRRVVGFAILRLRESLVADPKALASKAVEECLLDNGNNAHQHYIHENQNVNVQIDIPYRKEGVESVEDIQNGIAVHHGKEGAARGGKVPEDVNLIAKQGHAQQSIPDEERSDSDEELKHARKADLERPNQ
mmetsp:Transcript_29686/g.55975  ORF Transcript_29686/g.55975 Transcript_29686/m.55975 type:complete len:207 (+) Transcript_29686:338-958(+)